LRVNNDANDDVGDYVGANNDASNDVSNYVNASDK
jgi:hypothetical protein